MTFDISIERIVVPKGRRPINPATVKNLAESFAEIGIKYPISIRRVGTQLILVAGRHRLAAAKKLGWKKIKGELEGGDELESRIWEIAENLCRADFATAGERHQATADLLAVLEEKHLAAAAQDKACAGGKPPAQKEKRGGLRNPKVAARSKALDEAARMTGKSKDTLKKEAAMSRLTPQAASAATAAGISDSAKATVARAGDTAEAQLAKLATITAVEDRMMDNPLMQAWSRASKPVRLQFVNYVANSLREMLDT
jgi:ParB family chromosome partitioning protein